MEQYIFEQKELQILEALKSLAPERVTIRSAVLVETSDANMEKVLLALWMGKAEAKPAVVEPLTLRDTVGEWTPEEVTKKAAGPGLSMKTCDECGTQFQPVRGDQVLCGRSECRMARNRKIERRNRLAKQEAANIGEAAPAEVPLDGMPMQMGAGEE